MDTPYLSLLVLFLVTVISTGGGLASADVDPPGQIGVDERASLVDDTASLPEHPWPEGRPFPEQHDDIAAQGDVIILERTYRVEGEEEPLTEAELARCRAFAQDLGWQDQCDQMVRRLGQIHGDTGAHCRQFSWEEDRLRVYVGGAGWDRLPQDLLLVEGTEATAYTGSIIGLGIHGTWHDAAGPRSIGPIAHDGPGDLDFSVEHRDGVVYVDGAAVDPETWTVTWTYEIEGIARDGAATVTVTETFSLRVLEESHILFTSPPYPICF